MKKSIFIHKTKTAGSYVLSRLEAAICESYLMFDGWKLKTTYDQYLGKDLTSSDLDKIAQFELDNIKQMVHIHSTNISIENFNKFAAYNWFSFMFLRDPLDTISSSVVHFYFNKDADLDEINLQMNERLQFFLENDISWKLPEYWEKINWIGIPTENYFKKLFEILGLTYTPSEKINVSNNLGYKYYLENEYISKETHKKIISDPDFIKQQKLYEKLMSAN